MITYSSFLKPNLTFAFSRRHIHVELSTVAPVIMWQFTNVSISIFRPCTTFARGTHFGRGPHNVPTNPQNTAPSTVFSLPKRSNHKMRKEKQCIDLSGAKLQLCMAVLSPTLTEHTPWHYRAAHPCSTITQPIYLLNQKKTVDLSQISSCITSRAVAYAQVRQSAAQSRADLEMGCLPSEIPTLADSKPPSPHPPTSRTAANRKSLPH